MKNGRNKRWLIYPVVFFVILAAIVLVCRLSPSTDSNLLVNSMAALFFTGMIALIDSGIRYWKNKKQ